MDAIVRTVFTDVARMALVAVAAWLTKNGFQFDSSTFVAGGLSVFACGWAWWENKGQLRAENLLASYKKIFGERKTNPVRHVGRSQCSRSRVLCRARHRIGAVT